MLNAIALVAVLSATQGRLNVVSNLDLNKYAGRWYEIARLPNRFQNKCASDVEANYELRPDGRITVVNKCRDGNGSITEAAGVARRVEGAPPSVLQVRFAPAFLSFLSAVWGDYQVIALDDAHTHAVVGSPDRKYLWVLARTTGLDAPTYEKLIAIAKQQGFDVSRVVRTTHTR
jgi:apolipoprotein D and lipocalin family protein